MIDPARLRRWPFADVIHSYTADDAMRYALALGVGSDPMDARQLKFVNDTTAGAPLALPTMAVVLGFPGSWMQNPATGIDFAQIVHGEEKVVWHRPLPAAGTVVARHRVTRVVDKGPGRGATVTYDKALFDHASERGRAEGQEGRQVYTVSDRCYNRPELKQELRCADRLASLRAEGCTRPFSSFPLPL